MTIDNQEPCFYCEGTGECTEDLFDPTWTECPICDGTGLVDPVDPDFVPSGEWFE